MLCIARKRSGRCVLERRGASPREEQTEEK